MAHLVRRYRAFGVFTWTRSPAETGPEHAPIRVGSGTEVVGDRDQNALDSTRFHAKTDALPGLFALRND